MPAPNLTSPAISEMAVFSSVKLLLAEWLAYWLNGATKPLGANAASAWPSVQPAAIHFDQDWADKLDGVDLRVLVLQAGGEKGADSGVAGDTGEAATERLTLMIWVRAGGKVPDALGKNPAGALQRVTDALKAILNSPDSLGQLATKGLSLGLVRGPNLVENNNGPKVALFTIAAEADFKIAGL
jgi:hypothetical protein